MADQVQPTVAIIKPPGPLGQWGSLLVGAVTRAMTGAPAQEIVLDSEDATRAFLAEPAPAGQVLVSHFPRPELIDHLIANKVPTLLVIDDPPTVARFHLLRPKRAVADAMRFLTHSLSLMAPLARLGGKLVLTAADLDRRIEAMLADVAQNLFGRWDETLQAAALGALEAEAGERGRISYRTFILRGIDEQHLASRIDEAAAHTVAQVTRGLIDMVLGHPAPEVVWPHHIFHDGGTYTTPAPMMMDMTGPARCLYYGPYLHLPALSWTANVFLGFSNTVVDSQIKVEVFSGETIALFTSRVTRGGIYMMPIAFDIANPGLPVQIRIFTDRGEIEGRIGLAMVKMSPNREATP